MTRILNTLPFLVTRWFDAYNLRNEFRSYKVEISGPFTESIQPTVDEMILNATNEYNIRNYEATIQKFIQIREYVETLRNADLSYWREQAKLWQYVAILETLVFVILLLVMVLSYRRKLRQSKTLSQTFMCLQLLEKQDFFREMMILP